MDEKVIENKNLKDEITKLKNIIAMQQEKILFADDKKCQDHLFEIKFREKLSGMFSSTQIDQILNRTKKVFKWSNEDIAAAISLRSVSSKAYCYLREKKIILYQVNKFFPFIYFNSVLL